MNKKLFSPFSDTASGTTIPVIDKQELQSLKDTVTLVSANGILSVADKVTFVPLVTETNTTIDFLIDQALYATIDSLELSDARDAVMSYLEGLTPAWDDTGVDTNVNTATMNNLFGNLISELIEIQGKLEYYLLEKTQRLNADGRVADPLFYNTQSIVGIRSTTNISPTYTVGASNVTINLPAHLRKVAGRTGVVSLSYGATSAVWPFESYWIAYIVDSGLTGVASPVLNLTNNPDDLLHPDRYHVASGTTPASGGAGGDIGGGGGGGYRDTCVMYSSYMPDGRRAFSYKQGESLVVLDESNYKGFKYEKVTKNSVHEADCVRLVSESGISVVVSKTTPLTLQTGKTIFYNEVVGEKLAVLDKGRFRWENIVSAEDCGIQKVCFISANNSTYAAGEYKDRFIFTHNVTAKP